MVGNKTDLHQERAVSYEEGKKLAECWHATFLETSAKQNEVSRHFHDKLELSLYIYKSRVIYICFFCFVFWFCLTQSVADIFHSIVLQVERENGNTQEKSSCCIS